MKKIYKHPTAKLVCLDMEADAMLTASQERREIYDDYVPDYSGEPENKPEGWGTQW